MEPEVGQMYDLCGLFNYKDSLNECILRFV